ncbi:MAG: restriction endonuclease subunit S, partial [Ilumatobacteraceae bacterium]
PGRCAVWRVDRSGIAFQKALHRIRVEQRSVVLPDFLALMLEECIRSGRADRLFTGTTIKHLPQEKLRTIEIAVPSLEEQQAALEHLAEVAEAREQLQSSLIGTLRKSQALRRSLLAAAFSGRLTGAESDLSEAEEMIGA